MKKQIIAGLFISILFAPIASFADSYDGPYCYEDPKDFKVPIKSSDEYKKADDWQRDYWDMERETRGTCKNVSIHNVISLDNNISSDYLLTEHHGLSIECHRSSCDFTKLSERIDFATSSVMTMYDWKYAALLDKKFTTDFISSIYKDYKSLPELIIMNKEEVKDYINSNNQNDIGLCYKIGNKDTILALGEPDNGARWVCTYKVKEFSPYIIGIENLNSAGDYYLSPKELKYAKVVDSKLLPNVGFVDALGNPDSTYSYVSVTSPISSITNYWKFTKENNQIVLKWVKTEYLLDDGSKKVATPGDKSAISKLIGKITNSATSSEHNTNTSNSSSTSINTSTSTNISTSTDVRGDIKIYTEGPHNLSEFIKVLWIMLTSIFK